MTSTSINIGLNEKNSSRVLRPPGGGHTDIFGIRDTDNNAVTPSKRRNQPQSSIGSCFNMVEEDKSTVEENKPLDRQNGNTDLLKETDENQAPPEKEKEQEKKEPQASTPAGKRVRVPPGGFSSGLW
ncbi:uncharacterized protein LOC143197815 [Rhynchophorus ferrugineus]|uniref:uncharacterized protein LOC143197815 n=1 Tax=Rhynchophorus ferrugineus TaxID=354439 RepID=UPI003FCD9DBC